MRMVNISYAQIRDYDDPEAWLKRINPFVILLEQMTRQAELKSVHFINYEGLLKRNQAVYAFFFARKRKFLFPLKAHRYVKGIMPDVVLIHGLIFPWEMILLRLQLGRRVKFVAQHHAEKPLRSYKRVLQRIADRFISAYFFASHDLAKDWLDQGLIRKATKIHEVMEVASIFCPIERKEALIRTMVAGEKIYLWVGRFNQNKDPFTLIKAFKRFGALHPSVRLYVVYHQIDLLDSIRALLATDPDTQQQVVLVGSVPHDDMLYWYNSADFIVSTSHYEGSGLAVCEGMSCGCIPILTNIPSFRMMTTHGRCGLLFEPGNELGLLDAFEKSLHIKVDVEKPRVLSQHKENLSAEAIAGKMFNVISSL